MKVRNNGGGHANHSMFWTLMGKGKGGQPKGEFAEAIQKDLMGWDHFVKGFSDAAMNRFGSGWAWLVVDKSGKLGIESTPNQDSPLMGGLHRQRQQADPRPRRLGTRLLFEVPEQAAQITSTNFGTSSIGTKSPSDTPPRKRVDPTRRILV